MGIKPPASSQGSVRVAQFKSNAIDAADSWCVHGVLFELDICDLYLYEFVSNCIPA